MLRFLLEYRFIILVALAIIIFSIFEWQKTKGILYALILKAKGMAKDWVLKSGEKQEEWVVVNAYRFLPKEITVFINKERMRRLVHYLYHKAKDIVDDGEINNSIE
jgi:uncharacterized protein (UPF0333 family)